ncbi:MAG: hypothetical protein M3R04_06215, partial [bacterium]|nr:hypothetical protein [bacterium]
MADHNDHDSGHNSGRERLTPTAMLKGMKITFMQFFGALGGRNTITVQYPLEKKPMQPRFRGLHRLERYESGPYKG